MDPVCRAGAAPAALNWIADARGNAGITPMVLMRTFPVVDRGVDGCARRAQVGHDRPAAGITKAFSDPDGNRLVNGG